MLACWTVEIEDVKTAVHILATVRKPELLPAATLVFSTLRVGFPEAEVTVWGNALDKAAVVRDCAKSVGGGYVESIVGLTAHDVWIEALVNRMHEPFWIVDTDVVFFAEVRPPIGKEIVVGRFEPEFMEEWTGTRHVARLHTAVMWIDPSGVRSAAREWMAKFPQPWRNSAEFTWIRQTFVPVVLPGRGNATGASQGTREGAYAPLFYDTMAGVYQAFPERARAFTEEEDACFEHLHCGGYVDLVAAETKSGFGNSLAAFHQRVFENPEAARGARLKQAEYYKLRSYPDGATNPKKKRKAIV